MEAYLGGDDEQHVAQPVIHKYHMEMLESGSDFCRTDFLSYNVIVFCRTTDLSYHGFCRTTELCFV